MKRLISLLALVLVCSLLLVGCGSEDKKKAYDYDLDEYISLGDLDSIKLDKAKLATELTAAIDEIRSEYSVTENITDRPVQNGDTVNIDFEGKIDGETFEGGSSKAYDLVIGSDKFIPGFEDKLIGWNIGDNKDIELVFPEDYENDPSLAGKDVVFNVKINSIKAAVMPAISDKMVSEKAEYGTVAEFCDATVKTLSKDLVWTDYLASCLVTKYPEKETKVYYDNIIANYNQMAVYNNMTLEDLLTSYMGYDSTEAFFEYALNYAKTQVKEELVIYHTARTNDITLTDEKYNELGAGLAEEYNYESLDQFESEYGKEFIERLIYKDLIIEKILDGEEVSYDMPETSVEPETDESTDSSEDLDAPTEGTETEEPKETEEPTETKPEETKPAEVTGGETDVDAPDETVAETEAEAAATEADTTAQA